MAEIKPLSDLNTATTVASDDQFVINKESNNTYTTSKISPSNLGAQIGPYLTIPYYPNTGGDINGSVRIDAGPDTTVTALKVTDVGGFDAGSFAVKQSGVVVILGNGGPWLDLAPVRSVDFAATGGDVAIQVSNYSVPVFSVTDFGQTSIRGPVTIGHKDGGAGGPDLPGQIGVIASSSEDAGVLGYKLTKGDEVRFSVDYNGNATFSGDVTSPNVTTNTTNIASITTALTAIKAAAEDGATDLAGLKAAIATALASF